MLLLPTTKMEIDDEFRRKAKRFAQEEQIQRNSEDTILPEIQLLRMARKTQINLQA
jgi:hypothetical protein